MREIDYYPFGVQMPGRSFNSGEYRYGFQGQEKDDEIKGSGNSVNYKYRMHDPRVGRFFAVDPLASKYPHNSPYAFSENMVIHAIELEGLEAVVIYNRHLPDEKPIIRKRHASEGKRDRTTFGFIISHPFISGEIGKVKRGGTNISSVSGRIARHMAEGGNMSVGEGSERNAFRHALWSATINNEFGEDIGERATNVHEGVGYGQKACVDFSIEQDISDLQHADEIVDLLNNEIGQQVAGKFNEGASQIEIAKEVLKVQRKEGLYVATLNDDGNYTISRERTSFKQYSEAINKLETLDDKGMDQKDRDELGIK